MESNRELLDLYKSYGESLSGPLRAWPDRDLSGPFLISPESYWNQSMRLLIVGQETGGWSKNGDDPAAQMNVYRAFEQGRQYRTSPFWNVVRKLEIALGVYPYGCAWTNLNRYDEKGGPPSAEVEQLLRPLDALLREEIRILNPDVCFLFTNRKNDERLASIFQAVHFEAIQDLPEDHFMRLIHSDLPRLTFRCPHPRVMRQKSWEDGFFRVVERVCKETP